MRPDREQFAAKLDFEIKSVKWVFSLIWPRDAAAVQRQPAGVPQPIGPGADGSTACPGRPVCRYRHVDDIDVKLEGSRKLGVGLLTTPAIDEVFGERGPVTTHRAIGLALAGMLALAGCATTSAAPPPTPTPMPASTPTPTAAIADPLVEAMNGRARAADDPVALANQITAVERAVRDPNTPVDVVVASAQLQQVAYRRLGARPEWDAEVMALLPPELTEVVSLNVQSRRELRSINRTLGDTLPAWRIVAPEPADRLLGFYREAEAAFGVGWEYLAAINLVETVLGRIHGTSVAGAQGPMQFMPATWAAWGAGGDVNSTRDSIMAAGRYLAANGFTDAGGSDGALYQYNHHHGYVRGVAALARVMELDPQAFYGYYHWQVYYLTVAGDVLLPIGYEATERIPVADYLSANPP
jgi:membrane-bound lytic murein transglycosylase B